MTEEETTFNGIATAGIDRFIDKCSVLLRKDYSEFAIPCIPNFTVIPKINRVSLLILECKVQKMVHDFRKKRRYPEVVD